MPRPGAPQDVIAVRYAAFAEGGTVRPDALAEELARTRPLSVTMAEPVAARSSSAVPRCTTP